MKARRCSLCRALRAPAALWAVPGRRGRVCTVCLRAGHVDPLTGAEKKESPDA